MQPPKQKLNLPDVFHSLTSQMEVDQMEIRDDATYVARMTRTNKQILMTDLPTNVLQNIVCLMNARDLASLSGVCSLFQHMAYEVVPGLNLVLYDHQRRGLKWMLRRETPSLTCIPQPHPFILSSESESESATAVDLIEDRVITHPHVTASDACGGMFCDEPGLGKTITMLALILRTKGQTTDNTPVDTRGPSGRVNRPGLRSARSRGRSVGVEDLVSSGASLIVVPDPLVEHWKYQVETHVDPGALRVFVDPDCVEDRMARVGPICFRCNAVFDREAFQRLQPGFEFEMVEAVALETTNPDLNQNGRHGGRINQIQQMVNQDQRHNGDGGEPRGRGRNRRGQEANGQNAPRQPRRALDLTRDIHFIDASKAFYAATRIKELKEEFLLGNVHPSGRSSRRQARYLKAIIFSQFKEHIWHTKVAFAQQGVPTADFIAGLNPEARMKQLMRFRKDPNVNVLLLTEVGSHGLDLSFVTHIFLMDEIWDKSLEQQVVSRAHRMGASQAVVVEQLWMRGSVESQMLRPQEIEADLEEKKPKILASPTRISIHAGDSPGKSPKKSNTGGGTMFTSPSKKRKRHRVPSDGRKAAKGNKNTFLQRKLDYVLNNLRLLGENIVAEAGQVRFRVVGEHEEVIRQAVHVMPNQGSRGTAPTPPPTVAQTMAAPPPPSTDDAPVRSHSSARRRVTFKDGPMLGSSFHVPMSKHPSPDDIVSIDNSSDEEESKEVSKDENDEHDDTKMVQNARRSWPKRRRTIAPPTSDDDDEVKPPALKNMAAISTKVNGGGVVRLEAKVSSKAKAVSFATNDGDDSGTESQ
ncbi:hypothetical protein PF005_g4674 [Phytophthora fragariae]|nr:hypothetical protein PF005_g4674 [Phytophthora fragariae]